MSGNSLSIHDFGLYISRRKELLTLVKNHYPQHQKGMITLFAGFENDRATFRQESSFYYMTGIVEPGTVLTMSLDSHSYFYVPEYNVNRTRWAHSSTSIVQDNAQLFGVDAVISLGKPHNGYQSFSYFEYEEYEHLLKHIQAVIDQGGTIFTLTTCNRREYQQQQEVLRRIAHFIPQLFDHIVDISFLVHNMRRTKNKREIEKLYKAIEITILAHEAAAQVIKSDVSECEIQATIEYMFIGSCARTAFPSIVASGINGTVLHYTANKDYVVAGDLVVVDIGAEYDYYCADITRTYPVSGTFSSRQRELYMIVLETQEYIASLAQPGYWLSSKEHPEKSLHHLAKKYLSERGYDDYFIHGIGHYLGLDVHDVGDYSKPLQEGDVITIEPGIYIPEEKIGIRIEDDYWIVKGGSICLSEHLPKRPEDIELMMRDNHDNKKQLVSDMEAQS